MLFKHFSKSIKCVYIVLCGGSYNNIAGWKQKGKTPEWVESYLEFYDKARKYDEIKAKLGL